MKAAILSFALVLVLLLGVAARQGRLLEGFRATGTAAAQVVPILLLAILMMGFLNVLMPQAWVDRWLSDDAGWRGMGLAWLAGVLTPGGGGIGMPVAAGLLTGGASPAVVVTYLVSLSTLNVLRLPMEAGFYGWRITMIRWISCLLLPFLAGGLVRIVAPLWTR